MKINKKLFILLGGTIITANLALAGCSSTSVDEMKIPPNFEVVGTSNTYEFREIRSIKTGAHYYQIDGYFSYTLTPVIGSDQKPVVTNEK